MRPDIRIETLEQRVHFRSTVLFNDGFGGRQLNETLWHAPEFDPGGSSFLGRTQLKTAGSTLPAVRGGKVRLTLDTYNPTGFSFYGSEIISNQSFRAAAGMGISFKVKAKLNAPIEGGAVGGLFLYAVTSPTRHDEIDFELLSNQVVAGSNHVATNVYADEEFGEGSPASSALRRGALTGWHTYEIRLFTDAVEWYVDKKLVRTEYERVPAGPLQARLNLWAPDDLWPQAYNADIQPVTDAAANTQFSMDVTSVRVRSVRPTRPVPPLPPLDPGIHITRTPALGEFGHAEGRVAGLDLSQYDGVAVYIRVGGWWTKPTEDEPLTRIRANGIWSANITTGGSDELAVEIRAYLIPNGFDVPIVLGGQLPAALELLQMDAVLRT